MTAFEKLLSEIFSYSDSETLSRIQEYIGTSLMTSPAAAENVSTETPDSPEGAN